jgi:hypothetical protein
LEAIHKAIIRHNGNCGYPILEIRLNPYEAERLDFETFQGIPISTDKRIGTGRFHLICEADHSPSPPPGRVVKMPLHRETRDLEPVAA